MIEFDKIAEQIYSNLPQELLDATKDVLICIEDIVSDEIAAKLNTKPENIYGLYEGIPIPLKSTFQGSFIKDKITLYEIPIRKYAWNQEVYDLIKIIEKVLYHEIGHHLGWGHEKLKEYKI